MTDPESGWADVPPSTKIATRVEPWEEGEWIITVQGTPVGLTFANRTEAERVEWWLRTSVAEIGIVAQGCLAALSDSLDRRLLREAYDLLLEAGLSPQSHHTMFQIARLFDQEPTK